MSPTKNFKSKKRSLDKGNSSSKSKKLKPTTSPSKEPEAETDDSQITIANETHAFKMCL